MIALVLGAIMSLLPVDESPGVRHASIPLLKRCSSQRECLDMVASHVHGCTAKIQFRTGERVDAYNENENHNWLVPPKNEGSLLY